MENSQIIIVLLTLITILMTAVTIQLNRVADKMNKISDRLLVVETEHNNMKANCGKPDTDLIKDMKQLVQDFEVLQKLIQKQNG